MNPPGQSPQIPRPTFNEQMNALANKLADGSLDVKSEDGKYLLKKANRYERLFNRIKKTKENGNPFNFQSDDIYELPEDHKDSFVKLKHSENISIDTESVKSKSLEILKTREAELATPSSIARARKIFGGEIRSKTSELEKKVTEVEAALQDTTKDLEYFRAAHSRVLTDLQSAQTLLDNKNTKLTGFSNLEIDFEGLRNKINSLEIENKKLEAKIKELEKEKRSKLREPTEELKKEIDKLAGFDKLQKLIEELEKDTFDVLDEKWQDVNAFLAQYKRDLDNNKGDENETKRIKITAHIGIVRFRKEIEGIKTEVDELNYEGKDKYNEEEKAEIRKNPDPEKHPHEYIKKQILDALKTPEKEVGPNKSDKVELQEMLNSYFMMDVPSSSLFVYINEAGEERNKSGRNNKGVLYTEEEKAAFKRVPADKKYFEARNKSKIFDSPILRLMAVLDLNIKKYKDRNIFWSDGMDEEIRITITAQMREVEKFVATIRTMENSGDEKYLNFRNQIRKSVSDPKGIYALNFNKLGLNMESRKRLRDAMNMDELDGGTTANFIEEAQVKYKKDKDGENLYETKKLNDEDVLFPIEEMQPVRSRLMEKPRYKNDKKIGGGFGLTQNEIDALIEAFPNMRTDEQESIIKEINLPHILTYNRRKSSLIGDAQILLEKKSSCGRAWSAIKGGCSEAIKTNTPFKSEKLGSGNGRYEDTRNIDSALAKIGSSLMEKVFGVKITQEQQIQIGVASIAAAFYIETYDVHNGVVFQKTAKAAEAERQGEETFAQKYMKDGEVHNIIFSKDEYKNLVKPKIKESTSFRKRVNDFINGLNPFYTPKINY